MEMSPIAARIFSSLLEDHTGQQLLVARQWRLETALKPLMRERDIATLDQLAGMVATTRDPLLHEDVVEALLNHETFFFRDSGAFHLLADHALRGLAEKRHAERRLQIWCAGCSTGQEAYSLAMGFAEEAGRWAGWTIDILGTDISGRVIKRAQEALYSQFEVQRGLGVRQMLACFESVGDQWRVRSELRQKVNFQVHNLLGSPPAGGQFDVILCRNVLLYFSEDRRRQVFDRLRRAISADGVLMLGAGETVIGQTEAFVSDSECRGLYRPSGP